MGVEKVKTIGDAYVAVSIAADTIRSTDTPGRWAVRLAADPSKATASPTFMVATVAYRIQRTPAIDKSPLSKESLGRGAERSWQMNRLIEYLLGEVQ